MGGLFGWPGLVGESDPDASLEADRLLFRGLPGVLSESDWAARAKTLASYAVLYLDESQRGG